MANENINVNTAAADRIDPETLEAMRVMYETYLDQTFTKENTDELNKLRELIVYPYCDKHGVKHDTPLARAYTMFVIGFNCGMEFVQSLDNISK